LRVKKRNWPCASVLFCCALSGNDSIGDVMMTQPRGSCHSRTMYGQHCWVRLKCCPGVNNKVLFTREVRVLLRSSLGRWGLVDLENNSVLESCHFLAHTIYLISTTNNYVVNKGLGKTLGVFQAEQLLMELENVR
jgi:hypothetical protein